MQTKKKLTSYTKMCIKIISFFVIWMKPKIVCQKIQERHMIETYKRYCLENFVIYGW